MWNRTILLTTLLCATMSWGQCFGQGLQMGTDGVAYEANNATGPLLYREVPEANLVSVRAKISGQTAGLWSQAGVIARIPNAGAGENWQISWSFRAPAGGPFQLQSNQSLNGVEMELNDGGLTAADLTYVRLDNLGGGVFQAYRGSGPDDNNITWTPQMDAAMMPEPQTNANLVGQTLQVGVAAGSIGALAGASVLWDWVEIQTTTQTYKDDFDYTRDFGVDGVLGFNPGATTGGGIWNNILNATVGGMNSMSGPNKGRCLTCTWNVNGSGNFSGLNNWTPAILFDPVGNDTTAVFGAALVASPATVYTNSNVTVKQIDFDNAGTYVLGGPGSVTLDADSGNAAINVLQGSHEIQVDLILSDNVTATASAGATLDINAAVVLNGKSFTTAGAGTINLNNGTIAVGPGAGGGGLVNDGNLSGLGSVGGDFTQTGAGSLAVEVGGSVAQVLGSAELGGTLDVSLADGFTPALGQSYTVLTADSVTDFGLSLGGAAADMFNLTVGPSSVSLVAVAIPEPSTILLASLGLALGAYVRRRRHPDRSRLGEHHKMHRFFCALAALFVVGASVAQADILTFGTVGDPEEPVTYRDEFSTFFDYYGGGGSVPATTLVTSTPGATTKSWTAVYNETNGNDPALFPPIPFVANGVDENGMPRPDSLYITDTGFHVNTDPTVLGVGWESARNNAPFLLANVRAEDSFDAVIKINDQTGGNWSYTSIVARHAGPPHGLGSGDVLDPTEAFVTMGAFRPVLVDDPATPDVNETLNGTILSQNIGQFDADPMNDPDEQETQAGGAANGSPIWVRMTKSGAQFQSAVSFDGVAFTNYNIVFNQQLNVTGQLLEVGPTFQMHPNPQTAGHAEIEFFEITVRKTERPLDATWNPGTANASGNWNTGANWTSNSLPGVPDANSTDVFFTTANATSGPATIFNNRATPNIVRSLTFDSPNTYAISGPGGITLEPDPQSLIDVDETYIKVDSGAHQIDADLSISTAALNDNRIEVAAGGRLDINNTFNLQNGKQLFIRGGGRTNFNNNIDTGTAGTVIIAGGNLGGSGRINGQVQNGNATTPGGTVNPGTSVGTLTVDGIFNQHATGTLNIELGGTAAGQFDRLVGTSAMVIAGKIDVSLVNGFVPQVGNLFEILTATSQINVASIGTTLVAEDEPFYSLILTNTTQPNVHKLELRVDVVPPTGVPGDYNGNDVVDAADYTIWRDHLGETFQLDNEGGITPGVVNAADYAFWKSRFGATSGAGSGALGSSGSAVPEPTAFVLVLFGAVMMGIGNLRLPRP